MQRDLADLVEEDRPAVRLLEAAAVEAIREVLVQIEQIAPVTSTVLIEGESGTGKELVARAIHRLRPRRGERSWMPFATSSLPVPLSP